jgi:hypothetical protein
MYHERKPWEFLEDLLNADGIAAVKGYSTGKMPQAEAMQILSKVFLDESGLGE